MDEEKRKWCTVCFRMFNSASLGGMVVCGHCMKRPGDVYGNIIWSYFPEDLCQPIYEIITGAMKTDIFRNICQRNRYDDSADLWLIDNITHLIGKVVYTDESLENNKSFIEIYSMLDARTAGVHHELARSIYKELSNATN